MASISLRGIYKIYPGDIVAVSDFNMEIQDKEFIVLVGPSGCGKSTTLRMIAGLEDISKGELHIGDRLVNDVPPKNRDIAMVFQNYALYPHMTVYKNMAFGQQQVDVPQALYDTPCNMFVAGFIGSPQMNFIDGSLTKDGEEYFLELGGDRLFIEAAKSGDHLLPYVGRQVKMGIRPEDIKNDAAFLEAHPRAAIGATVAVTELMGNEIYLYLNYQGSKLTARVAPDHRPKTASEIRVAIDTRRVHLFDPETEKSLAAN